MNYKLMTLFLRKKDTATHQQKGIGGFIGMGVGIKITMDH